MLRSFTAFADLPLVNSRNLSIHIHLTDRPLCPDQKRRAASVRQCVYSTNRSIHIQRCPTPEGITASAGVGSTGVPPVLRTNECFRRCSAGGACLAGSA